MHALRLTVAVLLACAAGVRAADDNPLKNVKVGDWIEYKVAGKVQGGDVEIRLKKTVLGKSDTEVTLEMVVSKQGQDRKSTLVVKLDQPYGDELAQMPNAKDLKEVGRGEEKLTINGQTYQTNWREVEAPYKGVGVGTPNEDQKTTIRLWLCPEVPFGGMVRMRTVAGNLGTSVTELVGFGSAK